MKQCSKCKEEKEVTEFFKNRARHDGLENYCKICSGKKRVAYRANNKEKCSEAYKDYASRNKERIKAKASRQYKATRTDYVSVYELPCGYVGVTNNLHTRMKNHRNVHNRITEGYIVLAQCPTREEALDLEALYQTITKQKVDNEGRLRPIL